MSVERERSGDAQFAFEAQITGRFINHALHPPPIAKAVAASSGTRHAEINSRPAKTLALAPSAASPSGMTQHDDATTAPSPATSPKAANHFGETGTAGGADAAGVFCAASSMVMVCPFLTCWLSCTL